MSQDNQLSKNDPKIAVEDTAGSHTVLRAAAKVAAYQRLRQILMQECFGLTYKNLKVEDYE